MIVSPRATLAEVAREPRPIPMLLFVSVSVAVSAAVFLSTGVGKLAWLDEAVRQLEAFGQVVTPARYAQLRQMTEYSAYLALVQGLVGVPLLALLTAAILHGFSRTIRGATASFVQALGIVAASGVILALRQVVVMPVSYIRESMTNATNVGMMFPVLAEGTLAARFLGSFDLFAIWGLAVLAAGAAILYRRPTRRFAVALFSLYGVMAAALAIALGLLGGT